MPVWKLAATHPALGRSFQRPLGISEHAMFRESLLDGTTDILRRLELRLLNGVQDVHLFSDANIIRAWKSTKRRFPLAGATVVRRGIEGTGVGGTGVNWEPHFVVHEGSLSDLGAREIVFGHVANAEEARHQADTILDGPRQLSDDLLVQLHVFREANSESAREDVLHVIILMAHCVSDGMASRTLVRCFLDTLARGSGLATEPAQMPLEDRLDMAIPLEELQPEHLRMLSPARRLWRKAIATTILQMRFRKIQGGHTLPRRRSTDSTPLNVARSGLIETLLTQAQNTEVIAKCRQHKITFGSAFVVFSQVAMTRVLYRRYLRGEISEEEWEYRKRQPYINMGSINVRPYLDKAWFESGGGGDFVYSISVSAIHLPFMTVGAVDRAQDTKDTFLTGVPPFSDLLTLSRLLHRAGLAKKQAVEYLSHPLFFEIRSALARLRLKNQLFPVPPTRSAKAGGGQPLVVTNKPVTAFLGSSLGNVGLMSPVEYPLPDTHQLSPFASVPHPSRAGYGNAPSKVDMTPDPAIVVECESSHLHINPGGINLNALTSGGKLKIYAYYDGNMFEDEVVREWVDEVKEAMLWFVDQ